MSVWAKIRAALRREAKVAREVAEDLEEQLDVELSRRERQLDASPEERMQMTLDEIATSDESYERLKDQLPTTPPVSDDETRRED